MHKLLKRQMRRRLGVDGERAAAVLDELEALAAQGGMSPEAVRFVNGLAGFLGHVGLAYAQNDRDLELKTRSLDLCSDELLEANDRLRSELASRTRAIGSLRHTASGLLGGSEPSLPPGDDLESLSVLMADLVRQREASQRDLQGALLALANQKFALDQHAIVSITDVHGTITYANDRFCEISGYTRDELLGRNHRIVKSGMHPPELFAQMWAVISAGQVWHGELCNRSREGRFYWVNASIVPFCDQGGQPLQYIAIRTDISERKRIEGELADNERRFRSVVESLKEVIFRTDANGCWTYLNPAWTEITGFAIQHSLGRPSLKSVPAADRCYAATRFAALARQEIASIREEARYRTRDGRGRWLEIFARAEFDDGGRFTGIAGTLNDVTERRLALEQLHQQLHFVQELFEVLPLPIYLKDTAGRYLQFNKASEDFFGIRRSEWLGRTVADLLPAEQAALHAERDRQLLATVGQQIYEAQVEVRDGRRRDTIYHKATLTRPDGSIAGLLGAIVDITERKAQEAAVGAAESRLRHITNTVPAAVFQCEIGLRGVRYTFLSDRVSEITGHPRQAVFADASVITGQIADDDRQRVMRGAWVAAMQRQAWQDEYRIHLPNEALRWIRCQIHPAPELAADGATIYTGIWQDVSLLKEADARLREVTENIPVAVYQYHLSGAGGRTFRFFSRGLAQICGLSAEEAMASPEALHDLVHADDRELVNMSIAQAAASQSPWSVDFRLIDRHSGRIVWVHGEAHGKAMPDGSSLWNGYLADVSSAKMASEQLRLAKEDAEAANRAKSAFLANMSHEIRTPLNGVIGMTDLLLGSTLSHRQRAHLQIVKQSSDALLTILNDILDFSKIEAGKLVAERVSFNLRQVVGEMLKALALRASDKGIELIGDIAADVPTHVLGDPGRLRQVLVNLVGNAIKFTSQGEVIVRLECSAGDAGEVGLHFAIIDSGIGIPEEKLATIFDAFAQADGSITRRYGGTGLGLTISARLAELLGGHIRVDSMLGQGSTFHFTLRCGIDGQARPLPRKDRRLAGRRVLLLVENRHTRAVLARALAGAGAVVTAVESAAAALASVGTPPLADLVLLDACRSGVDGLALARRLRAAAGDAPMTQVLWSSWLGSIAAQACREAGVSACLPKPLTGDDLLAGLGGVFDGGPGATSTAVVVPEPPVASEPLAAAGAFDYGAALADADRETVELIAAAFLEHCPRDLDRMQRGLASADLQSVASVAHALQGTLAIFGALPAVSLAQRLEQYATFSEPSGLKPLLDGLRAEIDRLRIVLKPLADAAPAW